MFETAVWAKLIATFFIAMMASLAIGDWLEYKRLDTVTAVFGAGMILMFLGFVWSL